MFVRVLEVAVIVVMVWIFVSQVLWPIVTWKPLFPILRKKKRQLVHDLEEVHAEREEADLQSNLERERDVLRAVRTSPQATQPTEDKEQSK